jgi:hypothetical protein
VVPAGQDAHVVDRVLSLATAPARAYLPARHAPLVSGPEQVAIVSPIVEPKVPAGQGVHVAEPSREYVPNPQGPEH